MSGSLGGGKSSSSSETTPVTWQTLMHPAQKKALAKSAPILTARGMEGFGGQGITPQQREAQVGRLMDSLNANIGTQLSGLNRRAGVQGLTGGALEEARSGIAGSAGPAIVGGLRGIEDMNQQMAQQKIADFLGWMMWQPPHSQQSKSESSAWQAQGSYGMK
jgi:hypothetical protein